MLFIDEMGKEYEVDPKDEAAARKDGLTRVFSFRNPQGEEMLVKEQDVNKAQKAGFELINDRDAPEIGAGEAALRGLGSSLSFGLTDEIVGGLKAGKETLFGDSEESFGDIYKRERDLERLKNEAAWDQQGLAYGAGFTGGLLGSPISIIGKLGRKALGMGAKKAAPSISQVAGRGAVEGSVAGLGGGAGLGQAEGLKEVGKETAIGTLAGGVLGGTLGAIGKGAGKLTKSLSDEARENAMKKSIGYHTDIPRKMLQKAGVEPEDLILDLESRGVYSGAKSTEDVVRNLNKLAKRDSEKIGETIQEIDEVAKKNSENPNPFLDAILDYRQNTIKTLMDPKKTNTQDIEKIERLTKQFTKGIDKKYLGGKTPEELQELAQTNPKAVQELFDKSKKLGFQDLYREKSAISDKIRELRAKADTVQAKRAADMGKVINDTLKNFVQKNIPEEKAEDLLNRLSKDRRDMLFSRTAQKIAKESSSREGKNRGISLTDILVGGTAAGTLTPMLGPLALPVGLAVGSGGSRFMRTQGMGALYQPLKKTSQIASQGAFEKAAGGLTSGTVRLKEGFSNSNLLD